MEKFLDNDLERIQVTKYTDYHTFLNDYFAVARKRNPRFSYGAWAKKLDTKDTSTLTKIIKGQRTPGPRLVEKFITYFKFDENEAKYFRNLIHFEKLQGDPSMRFTVLDSLRKGASNGKRVLDPKDFALISDWYGYALRQLVKVRGFQPNAEWVCRHLRYNVTKEQIQKMFDNLIRIGALKVDTANQKIVISEALHTTEDRADNFIRKFHYQMLENAAKSISDVPVENREVTALTLAFNSSRIKEAKMLIRKFKSDFDLLMSGKDNTDCDSVYQFQIQFFPLSRSEQV